jgi:hypothetical protein
MASHAIYKGYNINICDADFYWLVGIVEGEGTFSNGASPHITVKMADEDIIRRVARLFEAPYHKVLPARQGWKPQYATSACGIKAIRWLQKLQPYMGNRRQEQIQRALNDFQFRLQQSKKQSDITQKIKAEYSAGGVSQAVLGNKYGYSQPHISRVLNGTRRKKLTTFKLQLEEQ